MGTQQILQTYSENFNLDTILGRILRDLGWVIVKILGYIVDAISGITDKLFVLDSFYSNPNVINFINSFKPLIAVLFAISFCTVGYELMFSQTKQFRKIAVNFFIAIIVILLLPTAMDKMNSLTGYGVSAVIGTPSNLTNQIIKENVVDLLLYDKENFDSNAIKQLASGNNINVENIRYIDPAALIEPDFFNDLKLQNQDVFKKRLSLTENGEISTEDLNQGWMTFWKDYYYRYSINLINIIVALGVVGATLVFTCFKLGKLIFELGYNKLLAILVAPADINNGQRTKQVIQNIFSIFIVVFFIAVLLKFYVLFVGMCANIKGMEYLVLMVAGSFVVIEGPNMIEKLFGIDAGLHGGFKTMAGAYLTGRAIAGGASKIGNLAKNIASSGGKIAGTAIGGSAGVISGLTGSNKKTESNGIYSDMNKGKGNNNEGTTKGNTLYSSMDKKVNEKAAKDNVNKGNEEKTEKPNEEKNNEVDENISIANTSNSKNSGGDNVSTNESNNSSSGSKKPTSLYSEMNSSNATNEDDKNTSINNTRNPMNPEGNNESNNNNGSKKPQSLYSEMNSKNSNGSNEIGGNSSAKDDSNTIYFQGNNSSHNESNAGNSRKDIGSNTPTDSTSSSIKTRSNMVSGNEEAPPAYTKMSNSGDRSNIDGHNSIENRSEPMQTSSNRVSGSNGQPKVYSKTDSGGNTPTENTSASQIKTGGNKINGSEEQPAIYSQTNSSGSSNIGGHNSIENRAEPIQTSSNRVSGSQEQPQVYSETNSGGSNDPGERTSTKNTSKLTHSVTSNSYDNDNSDKQTIAQYAKSKIREKVQNNDIYKQTIKSYNLGKNTAESIKNNNRSGTKNKRNK